MSVAAILLAAGASTRMGSPKALLPWRGTTLAGWSIQELRTAGVETVVVVLGGHAEAVRRALRDEPAMLVFNPRWAQGRATSLAAAARTLRAGPAPEFVVVQNVDQPAPASLVARLIEEARASDADAVQPVYLDEAGAEHGGHPVVLRGTLLPALAAATEATEGLRGVLARRAVRRVRIEGEPAVALDLDTPEAYEAARAMFG